jgi:hypothetical protein
MLQDQPHVLYQDLLAVIFGKEEHVEAGMSSWKVLGVGVTLDCEL